MICAGCRGTGVKAPIYDFQTGETVKPLCGCAMGQRRLAALLLDRQSETGQRPGRRSGAWRKARYASKR